MTAAEADSLCLELRTFSCENAFAYVVPPPRSSAGHRAEDWNVEKWLAKVTCTLFTLTGEQVPEGSAAVRLYDSQSGELFAECPLEPSVPIAAALEPVVDSSRYFVCRVADAASGRHAFVGLGFQSRDDSTDFKMALAEVQKARERQREAVRRRELHAAEVQAGGDSAPAAPRADLSLAADAKLVLNVPSLQKRKAAVAVAVAAGTGVALSPPPSHAFGLLSPPPGARTALLAPPPPLQPAGATRLDEDFGDFQ